MTSPTAIELMTASWRPQSTPVPTVSKQPLISRKPIRITATITWSTYQTLIQKSDLEGRSLSNLTSFILETYLQASTRPL